MKKETTKIEIKLQIDDIDRLVKELLSLMISKDRLIEEKASYGKALKDRLSEIDNRIYSIRNTLDEGAYAVERECVVSIDALTKTKKYIYEGKVVKEIPFTDDSVQEELDLPQQ